MGSLIKSNYLQFFSLRSLRLGGEKGLDKLLQEPYIPLEQQLNVVNAVAQHGHPVGAHAEGEAADLGRVVTVLAHELEHVGVHHAAAQQLDPAALLAGAAAFAPAEWAADLHVSAGLGEREERRIEPCLHRRAEQRLHGVIERALQIAEG